MGEVVWRGCAATLALMSLVQVDAHGNDNVGVKDGWKRNFFDRIKMVFGYGVPQFS